MAGYPGNSGEYSTKAGGLESFIAQMRGQRNSSSASNPPGTRFSPQLASPTTPYFDPTQVQQPSHGFHVATVSSPLPTPPTNNQPPRHPSAVMSPAVDAPQQRPLAPPNASSPASNTNHTNSLLNLLKFSSQPGSSTPSLSAPVSDHHSSSRTRSQASPSANGDNSSNLLATLMGSTGQKENAALSARLRATSQKSAPPPEPVAREPSADTQAYLLQLLNRPKPSQKDAQPLLEISAAASLSKNDLEAKVGDLAEAFHETSLGKGQEFESAQKPPQGLFNYVNPFDQLAASSPRNRTPKPATPTQIGPVAPPMQILKPPRHSASENSDLTKKVGDDSPKLSPIRNPVKKKAKHGTNAPSPLPDVRSQVQATAVPADSSAKNTVARALQEVGDQVDQQAEDALARAEDAESQAVIEKDLEDVMTAKTEKEFEDSAQVAAVDIKKELEREGPDVLKDNLPPEVANAVKEIVDDTANGNMPDRWDSEPSPGKEGSYVVKVYNFPMKPWISITAHPGEDQQLAVFRDESVMDIARLKKDFDQIDRTLATASPNFIAYGMSKFGGVRLIRQDDGKDEKLFDQTGDRIFHVTMSTAPDSPVEAVIAIGISGTVYWAEIRGSEGEQFIDGDLHEHGFALPPIQSPGEETSGGVLKTRARKSTGHPEFFAVGRGKSIHIIWPFVIMQQAYLKDGKDRIVDTPKYLQHRSLKINTGKAGKDFIFSEDDTTIVSLDKAGRVKFWDVSTLTDTERSDNLRFPTPEQIQPVEIKEPIMTLYTTPENQKAWPTSLLFIDKLRPYQKGGALRYLIVGLKQNHTLQLWDLGLGKPVQEINLPHEKESDAVCSISYHALTGILAVGHPTRNSIFFIHMSAPKYNLPKGCTQADFMKRLSKKDASLPKPEATAVMSGIREYSFSSKGQLRSLDILQTPISAANPDDPVLFELYAMHSKGITTFSIKAEDMGWNKDNRVIEPMQAVQDGFITIEPLKPLPQTDLSSEKPAASKATASRDVILKDSGRKSGAVGHVGNAGSFESPAQTASTPKSSTKVEASPPTTTNGGTDSMPSSNERPEKKKRRNRVAAAAQASTEAAPSPPQNAAPAVNLASTAVPTPVESNFSTSNGNATKEAVTDFSGVQNLSQGAVELMAKDLEKSFRFELDRAFTRTLDRFSIETRKQADQAVLRQQEVIRLISSSLENNVQKSLDSIISTNIEKAVLPAISAVTAKAVNDQLGSRLNSLVRSTIQSTVSSVVPKELSNILPDIVSRTLHKAEVLHLMADSLANSVAFKVEAEFAEILQNSITPSFLKLTQKAVAEVDRESQQHIAALQRQSKADSYKIDQLSALVTGLGEAISAMATSQSKYQAEFLKFQQQAARGRQPEHIGVNSASASASSAPVRTSSGIQLAPQTPQKAEEQLKLEHAVAEISATMNDGDYETACMQWLQHELDIQQAAFDTYFAKFDPAFVREISPLMLLSIASVITQQLEGQTLLERLSWLDVILHEFQSTFDTMEESVRDVTPKIMKILVQRLEHTLMRVSSVSPQDPLLKRITFLSSTANRIGMIVGSSAPAW
ncbi:MAG: hypothetical protein M1818_003960 [Claussenomyces sp. TS43310]|nr:MAG: hypothetical protein M1818_003960 [Claussenomyces sp. TS43310]